MGESGRFYFRVIESAEGWACRSGRHELDRHPLLVDALDHIRIVAAARRPSEIVVHHLDGRIVKGTVFD